MKISTLLPLLLLICHTVSSQLVPSCTNNKSDDSSKRVRPPSDKPTVVSVRLYVYFIGSIEAQNLQFTAHVLIQYRWNDPRLIKMGGALGETKLKEQIWTPHLYLVNEHESRVMGADKDDVLISINGNGTVMYSTRLKTSLLCFMNLKKFPFDYQRCPLVLESWGYNTTQLTLEWEPKQPVVVNRDLKLTEYSLVDFNINSTEQMYSIGDNYYETLSKQALFHSKFAGNYSCLSVQFLLNREVGHYIMDYYVPSILLVVVSWVSFWLDPNAVPGRTTLGTSTMLTFITLSRNIGSSLPKVSYIKATEIWFIVCTGFIFGSLVEFAFVNTIWRRKKNVELKKVNSKYILKSTLTPQMKRKQIPSLERSISYSSADDSKLTRNYNSQLSVTSIDSISRDPFPATSETNLTDQQPQNKGFFTMTPQEIAQWIDRRSRLVFPVTFLIFNIFYWIFVWF